MIHGADNEEDEYKGFLEISAGDPIIEHFYQDINYNHFKLHTNEYLILRNFDREIVDLRKWDGTTHQYLNYSDFSSEWLGKIKPYNNDPYQKMLFDSLSNNKITMVRGSAGSGKTIVSLGYLMS
jgi:predicted ribonuclease YlaK